MLVTAAEEQLSFLLASCRVGCRPAVACASRARTAGRRRSRRPNVPLVRQRVEEVHDVLSPTGRCDWPESSGSGTARRWRDRGMDRGAAEVAGPHGRRRHGRAASAEDGLVCSSLRSCRRRTASRSSAGRRCLRPSGARACRNWDRPRSTPEQRLVVGEGVQSVAVEVVERRAAVPVRRRAWS